MKRKTPRTRIERTLLGASLLALAAAISAASDSRADTYPGASVVPASQAGWQRWLMRAEPDAPRDEAAGGSTSSGTPISDRNALCFPTEPRNLFFEVDQVPSGPGGKLQPIDFAHDAPDHARAAIRGQNTWMLWGEGNEEFWDWLQQHGYGIADFLILLDSRERDKRFENQGLMNQPGMVARKDPSQRILGLYLDGPDGSQATLQGPKWDAHTTLPSPPATHAGRALFEPGDRELYEQAVSRLAQDGVDPQIYGYASGVVGLRLFPNPDFFGKGARPQEARRYWKERVENRTDDGYYTMASVHADPRLVRPFRVAMACAFCHIGPHPLNPPPDPEHPAWSNMSSLIGNQYWTPKTVFSNLRKESSFIYQFIASQQPGTIDTSLVSTDHINNANTINAIFDVPARLGRAAVNPPESQDARNLGIKSLEEGSSNPNPRHTPRVLLDGSDSVGVWGALARVYLNIGAYSEQWRRLHNTIIGFRPQRPFELATLRAKSVYWQVGEGHRIDELAAFLSYGDPAWKRPITAPMKLRDAHDATADGRAIVEDGAQKALAGKGRDVFLHHCAVCHSSLQPAGIELEFRDDWAQQPVPAGTEHARLVLPMRFADWERFKASAPYAEYLKRLDAYVRGLPPAGGGEDPFLSANFLSTDVRVPITLVGTNSGRAVATNAMEGQVWADFSSETYKHLPAVGGVRFYNPYLHDAPVDEWGNNDAYYPPAGGPGYYRPASLISVWATGPYLHNNALGTYNRDPSVKGRLAAFDDGIDKLLWRERRATPSGPWTREGDLRGKLSLGDPGFIYRTSQATYLDFPAPFVRPLVTGILGESLTNFASKTLWFALAALFVVLAFMAPQRTVGFVLALVAVLAGAALRFTAIDTLYPLAWAIPLVLVGLAVAAWFAPPRRFVAPAFFLVLAAGSIAISSVARHALDGAYGGVQLGPIPRGTPVNLVMNMNPEAPLLELARGGAGLVRGILRVRKEALEAPVRAGAAPDAQTRRKSYAESPEALRAFEQEAGPALMHASKCPDFVLDRGHWFGQSLSAEEKAQLKAFLLTL